VSLRSLQNSREKLTQKKRTLLA